MRFKHLRDTQLRVIIVSLCLLKFEREREGTRIIPVLFIGATAMDRVAYNYIAIDER